jgi:hypothetical protein
MLKDIPLSTRFCLVIKFCPCNLSPYRVWEVSVLSSDNEDSHFLFGLSVVSSNIKSIFDILGQFPLLFVCTWEGEVVGGGFFSYLLLFGSSLLGYGCIVEHDYIGFSYEVLQLRNLVFVLLIFLLADLF